MVESTLVSIGRRWEGLHAYGHMRLVELHLDTDYQYMYRIAYLTPPSFLEANTITKSMEIECILGRRCLRILCGC